MSRVTAFPAEHLHVPAARDTSVALKVRPVDSTASPRSAVERLALWAVAVPLGLLDGLHWYLQTPPVNPAVVVLHVLVAWTLYPALVPFAQSVTRRFPLDTAAWPRAVPVHLLAAVAFQYVHLQITHFLLVMVVRPIFFPGATTARYYFPGLPPQHLREYPIDLLAYWIIVGFFYAAHYRSELHQREVGAARLETSLAEARLELLRRQLSPHFLFNTLNTISVLAQNGNQTAFLETLSRLSNLLRVALDETQPQIVLLSDELKFLEGYIAIQQIRFADRLHVQLNVEKVSRRGLVPFMILQPLVENSIEHGFSALTSSTVVIIETTVKRSTLILRVNDSGPGFTNAPGPRHDRIGLANTASRLHQLYGDRQTIEYGHSPDGGASVTISIPFEQASDRD
ncbi:MAG: signal transduction histidine kinase, LytS [Acidobacteria bacterium]|nr:signal transduction histidine kinase, LytS [Acidobacteriota bacterium]